MLSLTLATVVQAQRWQFDAGVGVVTLQGIAQFASDRIINNNFLLLEKTTTSYQPAIYLEASYRFREKIDVGLHLSRSVYTEEYGESLAQTDFGSLERTYYTLMLTGDYYWRTPRENLELYSGVQFGYGVFVDQTTGDLEEDDLEPEDRTGTPAMQVTALGIRYGQALAIQVEGGFGFKGLLAVGISLRL